MSEVLHLFEKRVFDFSKLNVGATQSLTISERIDITNFGLGTMQLRVHSSDVSGGTIAFDLYGEGLSRDEPARDFVTNAPLFPSIAVQTGPGFSVSGGQILGEFARLKVTATKVSASPLLVTASLDLLVEEGVTLDPSTIFGPAVLGWWDANTGLSISGASVDSWTDRRNGFVIAQTGGNRPTYSATGWNGNQPTLTCTAASSLFLFTTTIPALVGAVDADDAQWAIFGVINIATIHDGDISSWQNSGTNRNMLRTTNSAGGRIAVHRDDGVTDVINETTATTGTGRHFVAGVCRGTTVDVWIDALKDVNGASSNLNATVANSFQIGPIDGDVSELVVVLGATTDQQVKSMRDYLRAKWGGLP